MARFDKGRCRVRAEESVVDPEGLRVKNQENQLLIVMEVGFPPRLTAANRCLCLSLLALCYKHTPGFSSCHVCLFMKVCTSADHQFAEAMMISGAS